MNSQLNYKGMGYRISQPLAIYIKCSSGDPTPAVLTDIGECWEDKAEDIEVTMETQSWSSEPYMSSVSHYSSVGVNRLCIQLSAKEVMTMGHKLHYLDSINTHFSRGIAVDVTIPCLCSDIDRYTWVKCLKRTITHRIFYVKIEEPLCERCLKSMGWDEWFANQYYSTSIALQSMGFSEYKFCHFAKSRASEYMSCLSAGRQYIGIGPGAHGRLSNGGSVCAYVNEADPVKWAEAVSKSSERVSHMKTLSNLECVTELLLNGLDTTTGVGLSSWQKYSSGICLSELASIEMIKNLVNDGMLCISADTIAIPKEHWLVSNSIVAAVINAIEGIL